MSLISLLIALAAERSLSSSTWQFNTYFQRYLSLVKHLGFMEKANSSTLYGAAFVFVPVILSVILLNIFDHVLLHLILSTLILIICFGCFKTRDAYKQYLMSAFRGDLSSCSFHHQILEQDKSLMNLSFGNILIWLNYRYFIAIMLFFVLFGAPGALFYRLLTTIVERRQDIEVQTTPNSDATNPEDEALVTVNSTAISEEVAGDSPDPDSVPEKAAAETNIFQKSLAIVDWLPVRLVTFAYILVGHFSKGFPIWLENLANVNKSPLEVLVSVAEKSEDVMVDTSDCTAEPCLLVRLAKRTSLLCLTILSLLILTGVIH